MNLPTMLREVLCPTRENDFHEKVVGQCAKGILESYLMTGRNNEVTAPRDLTPKSYNSIRSHESAMIETTKHMLPATPITKRAICRGCWNTV